MVSYSIGSCFGTVPSHKLSNNRYRIVPNFLVQTGDRTGTGSGGESIYGGMLASLTATTSI